MNKANREILFSVTANDCEFDYYVGSGKGGQKRNRTANCVRCTHVSSGAVGKSEDGRSQRKNKEAAFKRMANTKEFNNWHRLETSRQSGTLAGVDKIVDKQMKEIRVDVKDEGGKWVEE